MKSILLIYIFIFSLTSVAQIPLDGMIFHYEFNGNGNDESINAHHSSIYGATLVDDRLGNSESAYYFDGVDDYISLPNTDELKPGLQVSFSFWVKPITLNQSSNKFIDTDDEFNNYGGYWLSLSSANDGRIVVNYGGSIGGAGSEQRRSFTSDNKLTVNTWNHVVCIIRGSDDMSVFVDCRDVESGNYSGSGPTMVAHSSSAGSIGRESGNSDSPDSFYFNGTLDEFIFWDRALSNDEVNDLCSYYSSLSSIKESTIKEPLLVYPNPANEITSIVFSSETEAAATITVYNMLGEVVEANNVQVVAGNNTQEINVADYETGSYIVQIQLGEAVITSKLEVIK